MSDQAIRRRLVVIGHVQGVFFRDSTRDCAQRNGVCGWVRNREDGAVEAVLEGEPGAVQEVIDFCSQGPSRADVRSVELTDESVSSERLRGFEVR